MYTKYRQAWAWSLALTAPLLTTAVLLGWRSVWWTFAIYQVGMCLVLPAVDSLAVRRIGWRGHATLLGLLDEHGAPPRRPLQLALLSIALGLLSYGLVAGFLHFSSAISDPTERLRVSLGLWGIGPRQWPWLAAFMVTVHPLAEEGFWRGYLQTLLVPAAVAAREPGGHSSDAVPLHLAARGRTVTRVVALAALFAGYHAATLATFVPSRSLAATMFLGVWAGGCVWARLRRWTGSLWPAVFSHLGAVAGYTAFVPDLGA